MPRWLYWLLVLYATGMVLTILAFRMTPAAQTFTNYIEWPKFWAQDPSGMGNAVLYGLGIKNQPMPNPSDAVIPPIVTATGSQGPSSYGANGQVPRV